MIVESARPRLPDTLFPIEVARYGRAEGPVEYVLDQAFAFAVDSVGSVYVQDRSGGIRQFTQQGAFAGYVAKFGQGPGEIGSASALDATGEGVVAASDVGNRRITVLGRDAGPWDMRMPDGLPSYREGAIEFHDDGTLWLRYNPPYPATGGIPHPRPVFVRASDEGELVDTIYTPADAAADCPTLSDFQNRAGFWEDKREPFVPKVQWALGPDGTLVVGCNAAYVFTIYRPGSASPVKVSRAWTPVQVSHEEREFRAKLPMTKAGSTLPAYAKIILPGDGRIWVWPRQPDVKDAIAPEVAAQFGVDHTWALPWQGAFDVFSKEGDWLAVVRLPPRARYSGYPTEPPVVIRGDTLWALESDELDRETIVRYVVPGLQGT